MEIVAIVLFVVLVIALAWVISSLMRAKEAAREIRQAQFHESAPPGPSRSASTSELSHEPYGSMNCSPEVRRQAHGGVGSRHDKRDFDHR